MGVFPVLLVFGFVLGLAVDSGSAVPRYEDFGLSGPHMKQSRYTGVSRKGARGLIGDDISWVALLPLNIMEMFFNFPIHILQKISHFTNRSLQYFLGAEVVGFLDGLVSIVLFPLRFLWSAVSIPARVVFFFVSLPFKIFTWILNVVQVVVQRIFGLLFRHSMPYQVKALNQFLKGDIFGPIAYRIEDLIIKVQGLIRATLDWIFSTPTNSAASRLQLVSTLSDTLDSMVNTNHLLKQAV